MTISWPFSYTFLQRFHSKRRVLWEFFGPSIIPMCFHMWPNPRRVEFISSHLRSIGGVACQMVHEVVIKLSQKSSSLFYPFQISSRMTQYWGPFHLGISPFYQEVRLVLLRPVLEEPNWCAPPMDSHNYNIPPPSIHIRSGTW